MRAQAAHAVHSFPLCRFDIASDYGVHHALPADGTLSAFCEELYLLRIKTEDQ
jgi:hypothetical protein